MSKKVKSYKIIRIIEEKYEVQATSKAEAKLNISDPNSVTVIREKIKLINSEKPPAR